jgi:hypothetical protein
MSKIPTKKDWKSFDDGSVRNYTKSSTGATNVRMGVSARVMENLAHGWNHLLARNPRPMFNKSQTPDYADANGTDPLYTWRYDDNVDNGITYRVSIIATERTLDSNAVSNAVQWATANHYNIASATPPFTASTNIVYPTINRYHDVFEDEFTVTRVANSGPLDAEIEDGLSTFAGYTILSVSVQEDPVSQLETSEHIYCDPALASKGAPILADAAEDVRSRAHELRSTNLPIVMSWSAQTQTSNATPPGDTDGITCVNTVYTNLFDQNITTRNSDTPGATYDAQYCAAGDTNFLDDTKVKVVCRVKAFADGASGVSANVKFKGPETFADNEAIIPITLGTGLGWFGNSDHVVYLSSNVSGIVSTVNANKVDVFGKISAAGDFLDVYRIRCWIEHGFGMHTYHVELPRAGRG